MSPELARLAAGRRLEQQRLAAAAVLVGRRQWRHVDPGSIRASWSRLAPVILAMLTQAQAAAAAGAQDYVSAAVQAQNSAPDPAGVVGVQSLIGVASDGRDLAGLLVSPAYSALGLIADGATATQALRSARRDLDRILITQIQDAARVATGVGIVNDRACRGYVRVASAPCCARCAILAGKFYRHNEGFARHIHCDCVHAPAAGGLDPQSPRDLFDQMDAAQLKMAGWSDADARAIRDGADISQVTNARREMRSVRIAGREVLTTTSGTTRRGLAGQRLERSGARAMKAAGQRYGRVTVPRLMPEQIYIEAERFGWTREEIIRQLYRFGYII